MNFTISYLFNDPKNLIVLIIKHLFLIFYSDNMISDIIMNLENKISQRACVSVTVNGRRYRGLNIYQNKKGELDLYIPFNSKLPYSERSELKKQLIDFYKRIPGII
jgi:hypothetical protein